ncbi:sugar-binding transcriptional regulator [Paenibacillus sp. GCM10027626]|uniref:sugar-binding transcriptional regulator n=1 Tax=Paenibacillus sp. GCM10027626 TaxID=3273411 RepID=UPI00362C9FEB
MNKSTKNEQMSKNEFLEKVARLYYILELSQQEISEQLNIGRSSVARFLNEAKERGIIHFQIHSDWDRWRSPSLERTLLKRYKLKDCVVLRSENQSGNSFEALVSKYLNTVLPMEGSVGLGWGKTIHAIGTQIYLCDPRPKLKIVQLTGGSGAKEELMPTTSSVQLWAQSLQSKSCLLPAPAIARNAESRNSFLEDYSIKEVAEQIKKVSVGIVSIGHTGEDSTILSAKLAPDLTSEMLSARSVGDVIFHFFNEKGEFSYPSLSERVVGCTTEQFRNIPIRIGIAYGMNKVRAISGALKGNIFHVLITNDETARMLIGK